MGNLSSSQLKVATHTHSYDEVGISAGQNITIDNGEISAVDTTYTAGTGLSLSNGEFSADTTVLQEKLTAGTNIDITNNTISATDTTYTAGTGLTLNGTQFAVDTTTIATKADLSGKQDKATSGSTAPSTTPTYIGQQYIDTTNDKMYVATGTSSSSDWIEVGAGSGDMLYADFNWVAKTGETITLDLNSTITPSANFTVNAPSTIKDGQVYVLRVNSGATAYTMTLGTGITNPYSVSTTLTANYIDQFVFLAVGGSLELLPATDVDLSGKQDKATTGTAAPSSTPTYVGQSYVNTSTTTPFVATGTSASTDWQGIPILSKQTGAAARLKIWVGTQTAYDNLSGNYDSNTLYFTTGS